MNCLSMFILVAIFLFQLFDENMSRKTFIKEYVFWNKSDTFYRLYDTAVTWMQARQICEAEGTSLWVPNDLDEMEYLKGLFGNMKAHFTAVFIGMHDMFSKGDFVTIKGEPIADTIFDLFWGDGWPDDETGNERCVVMTRQGLFDDQPCDHTFPFVCEIHSNNTNKNTNCSNYDLDYKKENDKKCYKFHEEPLTWHDAFMVCALEKGNLAIVNSPEEANIVVSFLPDNLHSNAPDPSIVFLGFSDLLFPYQYRTIRGQSLEEAGYASWEIDTDDVGIMKQKRCGAIARSGSLLLTYCDQPAMFLCEIPLQSAFMQLKMAPTTTTTSTTDI